MWSEIGGNGRRLETLVVPMDDGWVTDSGGGGSINEFWVRRKMKVNKSNKSVKHFPLELLLFYSKKKKKKVSNWPTILVTPN